jgi:hypothetical protein
MPCRTRSFEPLLQGQAQRILVINNDWEPTHTDRIPRVHAPLPEGALKMTRQRSQ